MTTTIDHITKQLDRLYNAQAPETGIIKNFIKAETEANTQLRSYANNVKQKHLDNYVYFRGLTEFSNKCSKNCYYCGIRAGNKNVDRYDVTDEDILDAVRFAHEQNYGSVVLQAGERSDKHFVERVDKLLRKIKQITNDEIGITISLGEQNYETFKRWFESGAHRYLLRIESSNKILYYKIHPKNEKHSYEHRIQALYDLKDIGYQTGTGVMIGLPFQTRKDLVEDLLFMRRFDIDMVGMGPYIEHQDTPLYKYRNQLLPQQDRFEMTLNMISLLRIIMPDINIASATALQALDPMGREKALKAGANVIMPNVTPGMYRNSYKLYENKPCTDEEAADCVSCLEMRIGLTGNQVGYGKWGDSRHYHNRRGR
ncbi:[FeFe] hydrogenase H-cluster radical SAM maturase HydE [Salinivirga cyanobacteriivorans]